MGVPGWLLNIVMGFLKDRDMVVRYRGETTEAKQQPGGGPQGTLLGLLLFLITNKPLSPTHADHCQTTTMQDLDSAWTQGNLRFMIN